MIIDQVFEKLNETLIENPPFPLSIFHCGSTAMKQDTQQSDIDVVILYETLADFRKIKKTL